MTEAELPKDQISNQDINKEKIDLGNSSNHDDTKQKNIQSKAEQSENSALKSTLSSDDLKPFLNLVLSELETKRTDLLADIKNLSKKKNELEKESIHNQSESIAKHLKGFQDYLTVALQDLANKASQLEIVPEPVILQRSPLDENQQKETTEKQETIPALAETFKPDEKLIRSCLDQYLGQPDFYADPWKLRRSIDLKDADLLEDWFFNMGGRGAQPSRGNRSRNALVSAALIAIMGELYGDRFQTLILASQPERLGEWRRCLQDSLGLNREDFGPNSGVALFERANGLIERADRLEDRGDLPLIIIDSAEQNVGMAILQFPLWLAFSASPEELYAEEEFQ